MAKVIEAEVDFNGEYLSGATGEEYQRGYTEGKQDGYTSGYDEGYTKGDTNGYNNGYSTGYNDGFSKCESIETIIDESGVLEDSEATVTEKVEQLISGLKKFNFYKENLRNIRFSNNKNITEPPVIDCINLRHLEQLFYSCNNLEFKTVSLKNTQNVTVFGKFIYNTYIETLGVLDCSGAVNASSYNNMFAGNTSLVNLTFVPETIKFSITMASLSKLSTESIQSIIDGLATVETAQTLTLHTTVKAKLTTEQLETVYSKNWNIG